MTGMTSELLAYGINMPSRDGTQERNTSPDFIGQARDMHMDLDQKVAQ
jgi:hypothetical protein